MQLQLTNLTETSVDVEYYSTCDVLGVSFELTGVSVQSILRVDGQINDDDFIAFTNSHIQSLFLEESSFINRNNEYAALFRIYFDELIQDGVCLDYVSDVVNSEYAKVQGIKVGSCLSFNTVALEEVLPDVLDVYPNPAKDLIYVDLIVGERSNIDISMFDIKGRLCIVIVKGAINHHGNQAQAKIETGSLPEGIYVVRSKIGEDVLVSRITILD